MSSSMGLCAHNNTLNYCGACAKEKHSRKMGSRGYGPGSHSPFSEGKSRRMGYGPGSHSPFNDQRSRRMGGYMDTNAFAPQLGYADNGYPISPCGMGHAQAMGASEGSYDIGSVWASLSKGLESGIQNVGNVALAQVVQDASKNPGVQASLAESATSKIAAMLVKNKWAVIGGIVVVLGAVYFMAKK